jgi:hypothetical protein
LRNCSGGRDVAGFFFLAGFSSLEAPRIRSTVIDRRYIRYFGGFQQVQGNEFAAEPGKLAEQRKRAGQGQAREVDLEKFGVAGAVAGTVEDGVDVVEDVFGGEAGGQAVKTCPA